MRNEKCCHVNDENPPRDETERRHKVPDEKPVSTHHDIVHVAFIRGIELPEYVVNNSMSNDFEQE